MGVAGWVACGLGDLIEIEHGFAFKGEFFRTDPPGDILLTPGNFAIGGGFKRDKLKYYDGLVPDEFVLQPGDLLITMTDLSRGGDTLGYPAFVPDPTGRRYLHNQRLGKVLVLDATRLSKHFLYYLLCTNAYRSEILASATGTTVKHTSPSRIEACQFLLPPLGEQRAIARVLGALDDKIELNRRMNKTLEAMARAIFKSWFVDFDPVRAKMEGRQPAGMDAETAALSPDSLVHSELGEIPRGWQVGTIGDLGSLSRLSVNPAESPDEMFDLFSIPAFDQGCTPARARGDSIKSGKHLVTENAVLVSKLNPRIPRVWLPPSARERRQVSSTEFLVVCPSSHASRAHLYCLFASSGFRDELSARVTGTSSSHQRVRPEDFLAVQAVIPPDDAVSAFSKSVRPMFAEIEANLGQQETLTSLRDALLPKLLSGEIRVKDAAGLVEDAV
jgi:type I restriction enzyme S subunit